MLMRCIALATLLQIYTPSGVCAEKRILDTVKTGEVLIERDRWGIPHIYGQSLPAVAFGAGYAQGRRPSR